MGTWGPKLFQDDLALDVKDSYINELKSGKDNAEITASLISMYSDEIEDTDEGPVFWFALADIQWQKGRLLDDVKEMALKHIASGEDQKKWEEQAKEKDFLLRKEVLNELEKRLLSPMPPAKKISKPRIFVCPWQIGDVFAYQFVSEYSKEKGCYGKYIVIRKIENKIMWPEHTIPVVNVFFKIWNIVPQIADLKGINYLPVCYEDYSLPISYKLKILNKSNKTIPNDNLFLIAHIDEFNLPEDETFDSRHGYSGCWWKDLESTIIGRFEYNEEINSVRERKLRIVDLLDIFSDIKQTDQNLSIKHTFRVTTIMLEKTENGWEVYEYFEGKKLLETYFNNETDACTYFYLKVKISQEKGK